MSGETGYEIWRTRWSDGMQAKYWNLPANTTLLNDCGELNAGTRYRYQIRAYNAAGNGPLTEFDSAWTNFVNVSCP